MTEVLINHRRICQQECNSRTNRKMIVRRVKLASNRDNNLAKTDPRAVDLLEIVHSDLGGPIEVASIGGAKYFLTFTDDKSRKICILCVFPEIKGNIRNLKSICEVECQTGKKVNLRSDNG